MIALWESLPPMVQYVTVSTIKILVVTIGVILVVAFSTYFERKVIGSMQSRVGPNRVGPYGLCSRLPTLSSCCSRKSIVPSKSNRFLFVIAPLLTLIPALATWAVIPLNDSFVIADINAGLLYVLALTSLGVYGVILAGWATNSKYAFLGAMRSAAQIVAYEIAMGFALVGVLMAGGSLNLGDIVRGAGGRLHRTGSCCRCCRCSSSTGYPALRKPTAHRSTLPKANRKSSPASTSSIRASRSRCSSSPNTPTWC